MLDARVRRRKQNEEKKERKGQRMERSDGARVGSGGALGRATRRASHFPQSASPLSGNCSV